MILEVRIPKELRADFLEVRIPKGLRFERGLCELESQRWPGSVRINYSNNTN
jgi:hypothetical protein